MPRYRAFLVGSDNHIRGVEIINAPGDAEAVAKAKQLIDGCDVEVWSGGRYLTKLTSDDLEAGQNE